MSFNSITSEYLRELQQICKNALSDNSTSVELKSRPETHKFLSTLWKGIKNDEREISIRHETNVTGTRNTPDWRIEDLDSHGVFFYGDHKSIVLDGPYVPSESETQQIERYLALGRPLFIFDGIEFVFYETGSIHEFQVIELIPKPVDLESDWSSYAANPAVESKFRDLFRNPGFRRWSEEQLVRHVAIRARMLSDAIYVLLTYSEGSGATIAENKLIQVLAGLHREIYDHHDPTLTNPRSCADFIAQVLAFGLFFAHTHVITDEKSPELRKAMINAFWSNSKYTDSVSPLKPFVVINATLSDQLDAPNEVSRVYRELSEILAHAEYLGKDGKPRNYHALFESFFDEFNSVERYDRGVFYTPEVLTEWMISLVDAICIEIFRQPFQECADKIIDPCCGTGGFIESLAKTLSNVSSSQIPDLIGLEVLPAPYVLAHIRLAQSGIPSNVASQVQLFLVDTLSDQFEDPPLLTGSGLGKELASAAKSTEPDLQIVIGNPPSTIRVASEAPRQIIEDRMECFRPPKKKRTDRQNVQQALQNEAVRFLRWSCEKVLNSDKGIVALVLPNTLLDKVSFKYLRMWLLDQFDEFWIVELDEDVRTGSYTQSLFKVMQGRAVIVAVFEPTRRASSYHRVQNADKRIRSINYLNISRYSRQEKIEYLNQRIDLKQFTKIPISYERVQFAPTETYPKGMWASCWPLMDSEDSVGIFQTKCSGVKLSPSSLLFHTDSAVLESRCKQVGELHSQQSSYSSIIDSWFKGQKRIPSLEKLTLDVCTTLAAIGNNTQKNYLRYSYRPFVEGWVVYDTEVFKALSRAPGDGTRRRPELSHVFKNKGIGIGISPDPHDLGSTLTRFASFCWNLPDNDLAARGNSMIYTNKVLNKESVKSDAESNSKCDSNVSNDLAVLFHFSDDPSTEILYYIYAIISSSTYLEIFEGILFTSADPTQPIRIPIFCNLSSRRKISKLGYEIAQCEIEDHIVPKSQSYLVSRFEEQDEFELTKSVLDFDAGRIELYENQTKKVEFTDIPREVLALRISGHDVISKWLREREFKYFRRTFRRQDVESLTNLLDRVCQQLVLLKQLDEIISESLIDGETEEEVLVKPIKH